MQKSVRIVGFGGQGIITAGIILASSAVIEGYNAIQTQAYGSQSRGGASKADIIISDEEIYDFVIDYPDYLIALSQVGFDKYKKKIGENTILLVDSRIKINMDELPPHKELHRYPFVDKGEEIGNIIYAGPVMLGLINRYLGFPKIETIKKLYEERFPKGKEQNFKAIEAGVTLKEVK